MLNEGDKSWCSPSSVVRRPVSVSAETAGPGAGAWQQDARLAAVLELVFWWLEGGELARAAAACGAWRAAALRARAWRRLLRARAPPGPRGRAAADRALTALALLYDGACPWRALFVAAAAPWRLAGKVGAAPRARLAAAALSRAGDRLALVSEDGAVTVWRGGRGAWRQDGAGSVAALGWSGVARAEWAPAAHAPRLLLAGAAPLAASRGALAVLQPAASGAWRVAARAGGAGGCWAGADAFLSLELVRLSAPEHAPHFATDVWLNAASQEADSEFAGVAARALRVYNEEPALVTQVVCAETPLDARAAQEWAEAEAEAEADADEGEEEPHRGGETRGELLEEQLPDEAYYRATYEGAGGGDSAGAWVRLVLLACGARLLAWPLPGAAPPPLRVRVALADRVAARRQRRAQEAAAAAAPPAPPPSPAELRARCARPAARLRLPARVLGLAPHNSGRCVWAAYAGGAACASLPALRVLRVLPLAPAPGPLCYLQPAARDEYFASGCGAARVWGAAWGAGALLPHAHPALALLLPPLAAADPPTALVLTEDALHVWECVAPRAPPPRVAAR